MYDVHKVHHVGRDGGAYQSTEQRAVASPYCRLMTPGGFIFFVQAGRVYEDGGREIRFADLPPGMVQLIADLPRKVREEVGFGHLGEQA